MRSKTTSGFLAAFLMLFGTLGVSDASAQTPGATSYEEQLCDFWRIGFDVIEVTAWGAVAQPCRWRVEKGINFIDFLTVAQARGLESAETFDSTPEVSVLIYRMTQSGRAKVFEAKLQDVLDSTVPTPVLENQDLVLVKQEVKRKRRILTFANITSVVGTLSGTLLLYLRIRDGR
ncbi:MAG: hypothetical protein R2832_03970 [Rhodothermales bacterium]